MALEGGSEDDPGGGRVNTALKLDSGRFSVSRAVSVSSPPQKSPCHLNQQIH